MLDLAVSRIRLVAERPVLSLRLEMGKGQRQLFVLLTLTSLRRQPHRLQRHRRRPCFRRIRKGAAPNVPVRRLCNYVDENYSD